MVNTMVNRTVPPANAPRRVRRLTTQNRASQSRQRYGDWNGCDRASDT